MSIKSKIYNTYKQFGLLYLIKGLVKRVIAPLVKKTSFYILAIENHVPTDIKEDLIIVDEKNLDTFLKGNINYSAQLKRQLLNFIPQSTLAIIIIKENEAAGWGFVQKSGISKYATYTYEIPKGTYLLKNLFVNPKFRGQSIGKHINLARVNSITQNILPTVFVIPSNTYAIRNLEMYGFSKQVYVKDYLWFNKWHKRTIKVIGDQVLANLIIQGFKDE